MTDRAALDKILEALVMALKADHPGAYISVDSANYDYVKIDGRFNLRKVVAEAIFDERNVEDI